MILKNQLQKQLSQEMDFNKGKSDIIINILKRNASKLNLITGEATEIEQKKENLEFERIRNMGFRGIFWCFLVIFGPFQSNLAE